MLISVGICYTVFSDIITIRKGIFMVREKYSLYLAFILVLDIALLYPHTVFASLVDIIFGSFMLGMFFAYYFVIKD